METFRSKYPRIASTWIVEEFVGYLLPEPRSLAPICQSLFGSCKSSSRHVSTADKHNTVSGDAAV